MVWKSNLGGLLVVDSESESRELIDPELIITALSGIPFDARILLHVSSTARLNGKFS